MKNNEFLVILLPLFSFFFFLSIIPSISKILIISDSDQLIVQFRKQRRTKEPLDESERGE